MLADLEARKEAITARSATPSSTASRASSRQADWKRIDAELRRDAIAILKRIDRRGERPV